MTQNTVLTFSNKIKRTKRLKYAVSLLGGVIVLCLIGVLIFILLRTDELPKGAVVTNGVGCASIGRSILEKGGSAVDAAIAALFCEGVAVPQSMGLGGGFLMTIYKKKENRVYSLNSREVAPLLATEDMFKGDSNLSQKGGLSVAVPGELRGYWWAWKRFGKLPWNELVEPTIKACRQGILVTPYLESMLESNEEQIRNDPGLTEAFINPFTNDTYKQNEKIKRLRLASTLEVIAKEGGDAIHNGSLSRFVVADIQAKNGIITEEDLKLYEPEWQEPIQVQLPDNLTLYTAPLPGSGVILSFILNILKGYLDTSDPELLVNYQRIIESFKYAYGRRTELGDPNFINIGDLISKLTSEEYAFEIRQRILDNETSQDPAHYGAQTVQPDDHGTAHVSVLASNGDAVSVTSTINLYFGAGFMGEITGIIFNDEMDDFASPNMNSSYNIPPSVANFIRPKKRPLSSMCPSIIVNNNTDDVRLVIGAAGGTKITSSVALTIIRNIWFKEPIRTAVNDKRFHHQLFPMEVQLEEDYENDSILLYGLKKIGHNYTVSSSNGFSAETAIAVHKEGVQMSFDKRRQGETVFVY